MIYQIPVDQITGLAKYGLALSCTAVSDLAESDLARYAPPIREAAERLIFCTFPSNWPDAAGENALTRVAAANNRARIEVGDRGKWENAIQATKAN